MTTPAVEVATVEDAIGQTRMLLQGNIADEVNLIRTDLSYAEGPLTVALEYQPLSGVYMPGTTLSCGLNNWYVIQHVEGSKSVKVVQSPNGSGKANVSEGDVVLVNPRHTTFDIFRSINDVLRSLSSPTYGLYGIGSWTFTADGVSNAWTLTAQQADLLRPLSFRYENIAGNGDWYDMPSWSVNTFGSKRVLQSTVVPFGGTNLELTYAKSFTVAATVADDLIADCGLLPSMTDLPPLGAAIGLLGGQESRRVQPSSQGDARRAAEVGVGGSLQMAREWNRQFRERVQDEYANLLSYFPIQRQIP